MKKILPALSLLAIFASACHKANDGGGSTGSDFTTLETSVITDFTNNTAIGQYAGLSNAAVTLNATITTLNSTTTEANLLAAQSSWKGIRTNWEQCEGFLLGPVEASDYDPNTDTWPTDYQQMDSLLASSNPLETTDMANLPQSLRGYHPLEYIIFGKGNGRTASDLTPRLKQYMVSLAGDILYNNVQPLYNSWTAAPTLYSSQVLNAGSSTSTEFSTRLELFKTIVASMAGICEEVGTNKMYEPFINTDSTITESPYSSNTLIDFKNNIIGVQVVYLGVNGGKGISNLVAAKNQNLDNQMKAAIQSAISSFDNITERYELAIYNQRPQIQQTMAQLATLQALLEGDLNDFMIQYIKD